MTQTLEFNIGINEDTIVEGNQTFKITVTPPSGSTVSAPSRTITIVDDDTAKIEAKNVTVQEGNDVAIQVTTDKQIEGTLTFDLDVLQATATEDTNDITGDFSPYSKVNVSLTGNGPATANTFQTSAFNDNIVEGNETATITLTNVKFNGKAPSESNANLNVINGTVTIEDDQESVRFEVDPTSVEVTEGGNVTTKVKLVYENGATGSVGFTVAPQLNNGTATGSDFSLSTPSLDFSGANNQELTVIVQTTNDNVVEATENFTIAFPKDNITSDTGAKFADAVNSVAVTVKDNDSATVVLDGAVNGSEGGEDGSFVIGFADGKTVDVDVFVTLTASGTATPGGGITTSGDYLLTQEGNPLLGSNPPSFIAVIPANESSTTVTLDIVDDNVDEGTETFIIREGGVIPGATRPGVSSGGTAASLTIADNDGVIIPTNRSFAVRGTDWSSTVGSVAIADGSNVANSKVNVVELTYSGTIPPTAPTLIQVNGFNPSVATFTGLQDSYDAQTGKATYQLLGVNSLPSGRYKLSATDAGGTTDLSFDLQVADSDGNDSVGFADFAALASTFGDSSDPGDAPLPADFDGNGRVGFSDFALLATNFGDSVASLPAPAPPASNGGFAAVAAARMARESMFSNSVDEVFSEMDDSEDDSLDIFG